ncbi:hypothetical protein V8E54_002367 [Elaphomyces granulatus]
MVLYCTLRYATQHGDIGLLRRVIPRLCIYFHGGPSKNYAREMLYLWRLLSTDACPPAMQRAILRNSLITREGNLICSWVSIDLHIELLNLELKLILTARRNGTFGVDELFKNCVLLCDYASSLRNLFEIRLSRPSSGRHTHKDPKKDVRYLADLILVEGSITPTKAKSCTHQSLNLVGKGVNAIHSGAISNFNQQISELQRPKGDIRRTHPTGSNDDLSSNASENTEKDNSINGSDTGDDEGNMTAQTVISLGKRHICSNMFTDKHVDVWEAVVKIDLLSMARVVQSVHLYRLLLFPLPSSSGPPTDRVVQSWLAVSADS